MFERETVYPHAVDLHVPSFSLPHRLGGVNPNAPYLSSDAIAFVKHPNVGSSERSLRVAVAWRGSKTHANDRNRSCPIEQLAPLWTIPGVEWTSLQIGEAAAEADGTPLMRVDAYVKDFADTAYLIQGSDLVITVDTAVAHLAGALGARTWMMTPPLSEWRWGLDQPTTELYPSVRIFRQSKRGDWGGVIDQVRTSLAAWAGAT